MSKHNYSSNSLLTFTLTLVTIYKHYFVISFSKHCSRSCINSDKDDIARNVFNTASNYYPLKQNRILEAVKSMKKWDFLAQATVHFPFQELHVSNLHKLSFIFVKKQKV